MVAFDAVMALLMVLVALVLPILVLPILVLVDSDCKQPASLSGAKEDEVAELWTAEPKPANRAFLRRAVRAWAHVEAASAVKVAM